MLKDSNSSEVEHGFEVVAEVGELFAVVFALHPVLDSLCDILSAEIEHLLCILAPNLLKAPGRRVVEVQLANVAALVHVVLLDEVTDVNVWVRVELTLDRVQVGVKPVDMKGIHVVMDSLANSCRASLISPSVADEDIKDNLIFWIAFVEAIVDSAVDVHVPNSTSVHVNCPFEVLRLKDCWDGARRCACLWQIFKRSILLREGRVFACVHICSGDDEVSLNACLFKRCNDVFERLNKRVIVKQARRFEHMISETWIAAPPCNPDIVRGQCLPCL